MGNTQLTYKILQKPQREHSTDAHNFANHTSKRVNSLPREERSRRPQAILGLDQVGSKDFPA